MNPSLGGVFMGVLFLGLHLRTWYPGYKALRSRPLQHVGRLGPFVQAWCVGCLSIMVVGGLIGWIGDFTLWGLNAFGDGVLIFGVGAQAGTAPGTAGQPLTEGGLFLTLLIVLVLTPKGKEQWFGWLSGVGLGLSAGFAKYAAVPLASAVNIGGAWLTGLIAG